jgi:hypothetical protein
MSQFLIIDKDMQNKVIFSGKKIVLNDAAIVKTGLYRNDVDKFIQDGVHLIIQLKNGDVIVIENFFVEYADQLKSDLVFEEDDCAFLWFKLENDIVSFEEILGLEQLLPTISASGFNSLPWVTGGLAIGGTLTQINKKSSVNDDTGIPDLEKRREPPLI